MHSINKNLGCSALISVMLMYNMTEINAEQPKFLLIYVLL